MRLAMTVEDFLDGDKQSSFINRISAFLEIPTNRLKIAGIVESTRLRVL